MQQRRGTHPGSARQWWRCPTASSGPAGACARSAGKAQGAADVRASGSNSARRGGIWAAQTRSEAPSARHASPHVADCPGRPPRIRSAAVAAQHLHLQCLGCFPIRRSGMRATQRPRRRGQRVCSQRPGSPARRGDAHRPRRAFSDAHRPRLVGRPGLGTTGTHRARHSGEEDDGLHGCDRSCERAADGNRNAARVGRNWRALSDRVVLRTTWRHVWRPHGARRPMGGAGTHGVCSTPLCRSGSPSPLKMTPHVLPSAHFCGSSLCSWRHARGHNAPAPRLRRKVAESATRRRQKRQTRGLPMLPCRACGSTRLRGRALELALLGGCRSALQLALLRLPARRHWRQMVRRIGSSTHRAGRGLAAPRVSYSVSGCLVHLADASRYRSATRYVKHRTFGTAVAPLPRGPSRQRTLRAPWRRPRAAPARCGAPTASKAPRCGAARVALTPSDVALTPALAGVRSHGGRGRGRRGRRPAQLVAQRRAV